MIHIEILEEIDARVEARVTAQVKQLKTELKAELTEYVNQLAIYQVPSETETAEPAEPETVRERGKKR